jgi:hypothetical protein
MHTYTVSLRISSSALDVDQASKDIGLTPTQTRRVGERKSTDAFWDKALWELEVFPKGRSDWESLEAGLAALLKTFVSHEKVVQKYKENHDVFIWCGHFSPGFGGGPSLSPGILRELGDFGVPLSVESYSSNR